MRCLLVLHHEGDTRRVTLRQQTLRRVKVSRKTRIAHTNFHHVPRFHRNGRLELKYLRSAAIRRRKDNLLLGVDLAIDLEGKPDLTGCDGILENDRHAQKGSTEERYVAVEVVGSTVLDGGTQHLGSAESSLQFTLIVFFIHFAGILVRDKGKETKVTSAGFATKSSGGSLDGHQSPTSSGNGTRRSRGRGACQKSEEIVVSVSDGILDQQKTKPDEPSYVRVGGGEI